MALGIELAKAYIQILPSMDGIKKLLKEGLDESGESAGKSAGEKSGKSFIDSFKKILVTLGIGKIIKEAFNEGMDLQQSIGGTEAVFGDFADSIKEKAAEAFNTMGMSANEYMESANLLGSLFQGSGFDQSEAFELTTSAMQRAADVASIMGISTESAMQAIQGAAKNNFTMMDNLGVAMNATSLAAYAESKGMKDFVWDTASYAEKASLAMEMFMDRTEQYAGNFEREAGETLSGALGSLKSSASNLMGSLVLGNDIPESWDSFKTAIGNCANAFGTLWENSEAAQALTDWVNEHEEALTVLAIAVGALTAAIAAYAIAQNWSTICTTIATAATAVATTVTAAFGAVMGFITSPITLVILAIGALAIGIYEIIKHWDVIGPWLQNLWTDIQNGFMAAKEWVINAVLTVSTWLKEKAAAAIGWLQGKVEAIFNIGKALVEGLWNGISSRYTWIKDKISGWVGNVLDFIKNLFGIHSPSKETAWMGGMLVRGLAEGMQGGKGELNRAIEDITRMTTGTMSSGLDINARARQELSYGFDDVEFNGGIIAELRRLGDRMEKMRVVLDSGKTVGGLLTETDEQLGVRQKAAARGVV